MPKIASYHANHATLNKNSSKAQLQVVNKPFKILQQEFPPPKLMPPIEHQANVIYKIPCADCDWCSIGKLAGVLKLLRKNTSGMSKHVNVKTL